MKKGIVTFSGAGPGAKDLMTVRAYKAVEEADVIVYAGSLVCPDVLSHAKSACDIYDSAGMDLDQITRILIESARDGKAVLRLHTGDPSVYGATSEQMRVLDEAGIDYETIPGVSSAFAAAAALNVELTQPGISQTVTISRRAGRTPVPERENLRSIAAHGASLALYLSVANMDGLVADLLAAGEYTTKTAVAVIYRVSWPDEKIIRGTLGTIAEKVCEAGIKRQAMILVGDALLGKGEASKLYDASFSHGYRQKTLPADSGSQKKSASVTECKPLLRFGGRIAVYGLTQNGCVEAIRLAELLDGTAYISKKHAAGTVAKAEIFEANQLDALLSANWKQYDAHVFVMATGIVVRKIASLIECKEADPAVVVVDEKAQFAQSLIGGHLGGANRLVEDISTLAGTTAVVSTATDTQGLVAFDELAANKGWRIENRDSIKVLNTALLEGKQIGLTGFSDEDAQAYCYLENVQMLKDSDSFRSVDACVSLDCSEEHFDVPTLHLTRLPLVVGVGCNRGTPAVKIEAAISRTCLRYGIDFERIEHLSSIDLKKDESGILEAADKYGWKTHFVDAELLSKQSVPNPSLYVRQVVQTASVSEASVRAVGRGRLLAPKQKDDGVTVSIGTFGGLTPTSGDLKTSKAKKCLYAVGIGPGTPEGLTKQARDIISKADWVVGYTTYCKQIEWLRKSRNVYSTGMRSEIERCDEAVRLASEGNSVALICSGDAGVYGMAGLAIDRVEALGISDVGIKVVPGVTASSIGAAVVGAPLMNDFATISLSDLLTPREVIEQRIEAVAAANMVCVLYNPRSRKRKELFGCALERFTHYRGSDLCVAVVRDAGRVDEWTWVGKIKDIPIEEVNMTTLVILGNSETYLTGKYMVTKRGYDKKRK